MKILCRTFFSNIFTGYTTAQGELRKAFYRFFETALTDVPENTLDEVFDRCIVGWTQCTMFIPSFRVRAFSLSPITQPVTSIVRTRMDETGDEWRLTAKAKGFHNEVVSTLGHFLNLCSLHVTSRLRKETKERAQVQGAGGKRSSQTEKFVFNHKL